MSTNKKRTADGTAAPALKRRKASGISTSSGPASSHPLRQTSFPPDDSSALFGARSPSVDVDAMSLVSGSQVSVAAPVKKKRGRKSKAEKAREQTPSVVGGRAPTAASGASDAGGRGSKSVAGGAGGGDEGEGEDEGPTEVAATADVRTKEQKEEEHRMRGMLISAFSGDQFYRFENWRAANLSKASVRRVRSLPASVGLPPRLLALSNLALSWSTRQSPNPWPRTSSLACARWQRSSSATSSKAHDGCRASGLSAWTRSKPTSRHPRPPSTRPPIQMVKQLPGERMPKPMTGGDRCGQSTSARPCGGTGRGWRAAGSGCNGFTINSNREESRDFRRGQEGAGFSVDLVPTLALHWLGQAYLERTGLGVRRKNIDTHWGQLIS